MTFPKAFLLAMPLALVALLFSLVPLRAAERPNVIFILADDLGYGDLGCYGQKRIQTPNIDRLAAEGMRFTQCYAGSTVCAPSRGALMTGKHTGHATVRGNGSPEVPLGASETTVAQVFKAVGYETALIGKWGVGGNGTSGAPNRKGFDYFFGYLTQQEAHNYYPEFLWRNTEKVALEANLDGKQGTYTHDLLMSDALTFLKAKRAAPFFLYLPVTIPHANNEAKPNGQQVPSDAPYSDETWPQQEKNFAAMITRLDSGVGQIMALLKERGLDNDTLVFFSSDNGPHSEGGHDSNFFDSNGALRGIKRDLYEGGIRVPLIARWPGKIKAGATSAQLCAFWDVLPTMADLVGEPLPNEMDGVSILPALLDGKRVPHPPLYWEFYERGFAQAVREGDWKGVKTALQRPMELYDLSKDQSETKDLAAAQPEIAARLEALLRASHKDSPHWPTMPKPASPTTRPTVQAKKPATPSKMEFLF